MIAMLGRRIGLFALPLLCYALSSCQGSNTHHQDSCYAYGTFWDIHLYEGSKSDLEEIKGFISKTSSLFDVTDLGGSPKGLSALNKSDGFVELDPLVIDCLQKAMNIEEESGGAFNYHLGALTDLWISSLEEGEIPESSLVEEKLEEAKATSVEISGSKARRIGKGKVDLNAISKGYCALKIQESLKEKGFTKYLINGGSSTLLIGENHSSSGSVKVTLSDAPSRYFEAKNCAVSCSSTSRQTYEGGYSHIVSPFTGQAKSFYQAVYLRGSDPCSLDAYSTAAMVSDLDFAQVLESKNIDCAYVNEGKVTYESKGFLA